MDKRGIDSTTIKILTRTSNMICIIILSVCLLIIMLPGTEAFKFLITNGYFFKSSWFTIPMTLITFVVLAALFALLRNIKAQRILRAQQDKQILGMPLEQYGADTAAKAETPVQNNDSEGFMEINNGANIAAAQEAHIKRMIDMNIAETAKYGDLARQAIKAGKEDDARVFIGKKQDLEAAHKALDAAYNNVVNIRRMSGGIMGNVQSQTINVKTTVMKNGKIVNQTSYSNNPQGAPEVFSSLGGEADRLLAQANAMLAAMGNMQADPSIELHRQAVQGDPSYNAVSNTFPKDEAEALAEKYAAQRSAAPAGENKNAVHTKASVNEELEKIKSDMGM